MTREAKEENQWVRDEYLAGLAGERAEARKRHEQAIDAELEPAKVQERRRWLADHPDKTERDFELVWQQHLRAEKGTSTLPARIRQRRRRVAPR